MKAESVETKKEIQLEPVETKEELELEPGGFTEVEGNHREC